MQCLFIEDVKYLRLCNRDENSVKIPTSETNMSILIKDIMNSCNNNDSSININTNNNNDDNDSDSLIDIKHLFLLVLNYIGNLQNSNAKKLNSSKLHKNVNISGGFRNIQELFQNNNNNNNNNNDNSLQNNINETLKYTGEKIHDLIKEYKHIIYQNDLCNNDINTLKEFIDNNPEIYIYQNTNISFKFMMQFISNLFNSLFLEILPKTSMINCLYATLYQASVLNELNILKYNSNIIQLPLMYRLIYSFYKNESYQLENFDNNNNNDDDINKLKRLIDKLCNQEKDIDTLCQIALRINIQDTKQLNTLFWLLNEKRGYTYEFYIIIIISLYVLSKCQNMSKTNKFSNSKTFGEPLYDILFLFYKYVVFEIQNLQIALCTKTFDNFNLIYANDIKIYIQKFLKNIHYPFN